MAAGEGGGSTQGTSEAPEVFYDEFFRRRKKNGAWVITDAPALEAPAVDVHAHIQYLPDPALALARAGAHDVGFVCTVVDVVEDGPTVFDKLRQWEGEAARGIRRIAPRC